MRESPATEESGLLLPLSLARLPARPDLPTALANLDLSLGGAAVETSLCSCTGGCGDCKSPLPPASYSFGGCRICAAKRQIRVVLWNMLAIC